MKKILGSLAISFLIALALTGVTARSAAAQNVPVLHNPIIIHEVHHDVSLPLRDIIKNFPPAPLETRLMREPRTGRPPIIGSGPDAAVQKIQLPLVHAMPGLSFAGVGNGDYGYHDSVAPPDTNASVGATQVLQWVNLSYAIFNKTTGALIAGPTPGNSFWSGFGGQCQTANDGDITAKYDQIAGRWVVGQLAVESTPYLYCIAVSTTSDATGTYNRYSVSFGTNFDDYPKMSVWPDAYYLGVNIFANGFSYTGPEMCAMNRTAMLNGQTMTAQCFQPSDHNSETFALPSDVDGATLPPSGEPNFFVDLFNSTTLHLFKFHVDFNNPANSTLTGPTAITVASYNEACGGFGSCVPQPSPGELLDSLGDRVMFRLSYRNYGDHESLYVNDSVNPGGSNVSGVRWYEIQNPNGTPTVAQQSTFANSRASLWMGSIASDKVGDLGLGMSASSSSIHPSIVVTGRTPSDPANMMETPKIAKNGAGSQENTSNRWGDYSSMALDPGDDCTFWYTTEYYKANGSFAWSTQIVSFKFPGCH